ncbi:MAG: SDR family oxidoreductase [Tannerellaceae bacterium]|nr:SDR family oxidoreductase [Tannerellaceae bacterium]MCD8179234.1 SDR family oxidoreductase [Tannerellaceae bacterium]
MDTLKGKNALVTGSSSGIGKAIALLFAKEGANVIVTYHSGKERADEVVKEISQYGVKTKAYGVDVAAEADVKKLFAMVDEEFGDLNILVNNAGINGSGIPVEDMSTEIWDRVIKTNLYGPFFCSREYLQYKKKYKTYKGSRIINVTSIHEYVNVPGNANYNASKSGMRNFAYTMALELASREMTVNNIAPGMILTPINEKVIDDPKKLQAADDIIPFHRGGDPMEVAQVALFLASDASSYVSGSTYTVDGCLSILGPNA